MTDLLPDLAPTTIDPASLPSVAPSSPEEALSWLGETVEEIAEGLRARGIKGLKCSAPHCPLAQYLRVWWPYVVIYTNYATERNQERWEGNTPLPHLAFIKLFDAGAFSDLIDD